MKISTKDYNYKKSLGCIHYIILLTLIYTYVSIPLSYAYSIYIHISMRSFSTLPYTYFICNTRNHLNNFKYNRCVCVCVYIINTCEMVIDYKMWGCNSDRVINSHLDFYFYSTDSNRLKNEGFVASITATPSSQIRLSIYE